MLDVNVCKNRLTYFVEIYIFYEYVPFVRRDEYNYMDTSLEFNKNSIIHRQCDSFKFK